ncbi:MAG: glycerophosphodiester phosphodiesterase [Promethearchaeota archaeon]
MKPLVCAHRGLSPEYPENTTLAIKKAIEIGVDYIEIDVHKTKDSKLVVSHDPNLKRCTGKEGIIKDLDFNQILEHDLPRGQKIPLLADVLDVIKDSGTKLNIEIKAFECEQLLVDLVTSKAVEDQVQYSSFLFPVLMEMEDVDPRAELCPLIGYVCNFKVEDLLKQVKMVNARYINLQYTCITAELVKSAHENGIGVQAWTPDSQDDLQLMIDIGVDIIITNEPRRLLSMLQGS